MVPGGQTRNLKKGKRMAAFILWAGMGGVFIAYGIYACYTKKTMPFGFWANAEPPQVKDVKAYNRAVGRLWCVFGIVFVLLGLPLLTGQNTPYIVFSILGCMAETIGAMAVYVTVIEKKYHKDGSGTGTGMH